MNDFVSAGATHEYVRQLEARVAALEATAAAAAAALSAPPTDRRKYMREYMARKRAAQHPRVPSPKATDSCI